MYEVVLKQKTNLDDCSEGIQSPIDNREGQTIDCNNRRYVMI